MNTLLAEIDNEFANAFFQAFVLNLGHEYIDQRFDLIKPEKRNYSGCLCINKLGKTLVDLFGLDFAIYLGKTNKLWREILIINGNDNFQSWKVANRLLYISLINELNKACQNAGKMFLFYPSAPRDFVDTIALRLPINKFTHLGNSQKVDQRSKIEDIFLFLAGTTNIPMHFDSGTGIVAISLAKLLNSWACEVLESHYLIHTIIEQLASKKVQKISITNMKRKLEEAVLAILPTLSLNEIVLWAREMLRDEREELPDAINEFIKRGKFSCKKCGYEAGIYFDSLSNISSRILVEWAWWNGIEEKYICDITFPPKNIDAKEKARLKNLQHRFQAWPKQANKLSIHAIQEINECLLARNLLPKGLGCYFFAQSLQDIEPNSGGRGGQERLAYHPTKYWTSHSPSNQEVAVALSSIAKCAHYLLADLPTERDTIESLMWLVSQYCHRGLGIPDRIDLRAHLLQAARGEPALHTLKNYYRDHFFHALEVCFLGHFLLDLKMQGNKPLWESVAEALGYPGARRRVLRLWYLAALLHDIGYAIDVLKAVNKMLGFFQNDECLKQLCDDLTEGMGDLSARLASEHFPAHKKSDKPGEDHGIVGARHLEELISKISKDDPSVKLQDYLPAIHAIALHNCRRHKVSFKESPLAFLLILCDVIQEWNRPQLDFASAPIRILTRLMSQGFGEEDFCGPLESVAINAQKAGSHAEDGFKVDGDILHFTLGYSQDIKFNAGVFNLWLDASCNFQRLDFEGLPAELDIEVEYVTPPYFRQGEGPMRQMHRLHDAAQATHMGFIEMWFPNREVTDGEEKITNGAVTYWPEYKKDQPGTMAYEHLVLHLRKLSQQKLITRDIEAFRERLQQWKDFNEDRDFEGDYAVPDHPS